MRVLLASPGMALGGAERVVAGLAEGLLARGHDVVVSGAPGPLDASLPPGIGRIVLPERGRSPLGALEWALRLAPRLRVWRPDVIHGHNAKATAAAALVHAAEPAARFAIVGDGPLRGALETLAGELGLDGAVRFTGARADARALIARADVLVVASDSEGQSLVALEALAAGTPVVATPVAGMAGLAGVSVVAGFTPEALAGEVTELLRAPARRAALGAAGAALARADLTLDAMVDAYAALYGALLRGGNTMR